MLGLGILQPFTDIGGSDAPHIVDSGQFLLGSLGQGVEAAKMGGEDLPRFLPHLPDAQSIEQTLQAPVLAGGNGVYGVPRRLFSHTFQIRQLVSGQKVQVRRGLDQLLIDELLDDGGAYAVDVHGVPAGKVGQISVELGGTLRAGAADGRTVLVSDNRRAAHGAELGKAVGLGVLWPEVPEDLYHLGDDLTGLLQDHRIADTDVLFLNKILIVQSGVGNCSARQTHRLHHYLGGQHPRPAHLDHDLQHTAGLLLRRVLVGNGPAGTFGCTSYSCTF